MAASCGSSGPLAASSAPAERGSRRRPRAASRLTAPAEDPRGLTWDGVAVPGLLLLVARHLALHDPPRILAWRLAHDDTLAGASAWLGGLLPRPAPALDRDPIALLLAAVVSGIAVLYLFASALGWSPRVRAALLAGAGTALVVVPTVCFVAMGAVTGRPYGQDGGVVQLPLAMDLILDGHSPYGADYSGTILGRQARVSDFWSPRGGNPILRHHAYLPGTHFLMMPFVAPSRAAFGLFDPRLVTLLAYALAAGLAAGLARSGERGLIAAAAVLVSPLVYWQQVFGANDVLTAALLLGAARLAGGRPLWAAAVLGVACSVKQLAWPFAPFLLAHLSGARGLSELLAGAPRRQLLRTSGVALAVFVAVVAPVAALDLKAFWGDVVAYNVGLPGGDNYPLGGTPGFGFANFLIYFGAVSSLDAHVPFSAFYILLLPLGLLLLRAQLRAGTVGDALLAGSSALLLSVYFSRVVHPNYLILAAILVPAGLCAAGARRPASGFVCGLVLLLLAVEVAEGRVFQGVWQDAAAAGSAPLPDFLMPRAGPALTEDPLGLLVSATAAGLGVAFVVSAALGAGEGFRRGLVAAALVCVVGVPTVVAIRSGGPDRTRLQHQGAAAAWHAAHPGAPEGAVREAWPLSFRKEPPAALGVDGGSTLARRAGSTLGAIGIRDPRWLLLGAALVIAGAAVRLQPSGAAALTVGALLLGPAGALGVAFGGSEPAVVAVALAALLPFVPAAVALGGLGAASAVWPRLLGSAPRGRKRTSRPLSPVALGLLGGAAVITAAGGLGVWRELAALQPGMGAANFWLYVGTAPGTASWALAAAAAGAAAAAVALCGRAPHLAPGFALLLAWLVPSAGPDAVLLPLALGLLALRRLEAPAEG